MFTCYFILVFSIFRVNAYTRHEFVISQVNEVFDLNCSNAEDFTRPVPLRGTLNTGWKAPSTLPSFLVTPKMQTTTQKDPMLHVQNILNNFLFGPRYIQANEEDKIQKLSLEETDPLEQYPQGSEMRGELFNNKSAVHLPPVELMHRGHCRLKVTYDMMQTALDAFGILLGGNVQDVLALPKDYVLRSARTIAMMKIRNEKLLALWAVVKGDRKTSEIPYYELEMYRPLFKYVSGREMARLNLSDDRILRYIGTHPELDRHQMGVVAAKILRSYPNWRAPRTINLMNNILCGIPMHIMHNLSIDIFLQFPHQTFYHIRACDAIQRHFLLQLMMRTEVFGRPYSWDARDVSRLGLLMADVEAHDLSLINPESMSGITARVMMNFNPCKLKYFTELQINNLGMKTLNILTKKLKLLQKKQCVYSSAHFNISLNYMTNMLLLIIIVLLYVI